MLDIIDLRFADEASVTEVASFAAMLRCENRIADKIKYAPYSYLLPEEKRFHAAVQAGGLLRIVREPSPGDDEKAVLEVAENLNLTDAHGRTALVCLSREPGLPDPESAQVFGKYEPLIRELSTFVMDKCSAVLQGRDHTSHDLVYTSMMGFARDTFAVWIPTALQLPQE